LLPARHSFAGKIVAAKQTKCQLSFRFGVFMGVDLNGIQLLIEAQKRGVSFKRMASLGRQGLYVNRHELISVLREAGYAMPQDCVRRLMDPTTKYAEDFFRLLGAKEIVAIDASDYEGAQIVHDMNRPVPDSLVSCFDVVLDGGTLEHVFDFATALRNAAQMVRPDGLLISYTMANNFCGHGFYQFSPELFYRFLCPKNGYSMERCIVWEDIPASRFYSVPDPESVQSRIEFTSDTGTYMMVQAKRVGDVSRDFIPQQSDYVRLWDEPAEAARAGSAIAKLKAALKRSRPLRSVVYALRRLLRLEIRQQRMKRNARGFLTPLPNLRVIR
jgi:SAM-dependent methyltransferase